MDKKKLLRTQRKLKQGPRWAARLAEYRAQKKHKKARKQSKKSRRKNRNG